MAGANPKLTVVVEDKWLGHEKLRPYVEKGHNVMSLTQWRCALNPPTPHLWLLENGHKWDETDWDYLEGAFASARARYRKAKR